MRDSHFSGSALGNSNTSPDAAYINRVESGVTFPELTRNVIVYDTRSKASFQPRIRRAWDVGAKRLRVLQKNPDATQYDGTAVYHGLTTNRSDNVARPPN